ncbi:hypothetical protein FACS1894180_3040 [Bacteroidia bacterium]|nr:hypothetical protein FACS1894180_3040 [Bacteroidia bacterium]
MFKFSKYAEIAELPNDSSKSLYFSIKTGELVLMSSNVKNIIDKKEWNKLSFQELSELIRCELLVCENEDEKSLVFKIDEAMQERNDMLLVTIQPTANCQFDCHYCGQVHTKTAMSDEIFIKTLDRIKRILTEKHYTKLSCSMRNN